jgi:ADP-ribosylglycohydrolase
MEERMLAPDRWLTFARGSLLGLVLGDAVGAVNGQVPPTGQLRARTGGQLACFTTEGLIRADVRFSHKGICHPPSVVWHAYRRWAAMQGLIPRQFSDSWTPDKWPDGWLADVPLLKEQRGTAPATVKALVANRQGTVREPVGTSVGAHACTRALPVGLFSPLPIAVELAAEITALTHCGEAIVAAAIGAGTVRMIGEGHRLEQAYVLARSRVDLAVRPQVVADVPILYEALKAAGENPGDLAQIRKLASNATALSALAGGLYAAASFTDRGDVRQALCFAASAGDGGHAATVAGALLGALHGPDALPVDWLSRAELVWVADTLARDVVAEITQHPSGGEYSEGTDPYWYERYPGW